MAQVKSPTNDTQTERKKVKVSEEVTYRGATHLKKGNVLTFVVV